MVDKHWWIDTNKHLIISMFPRNHVKLVKEKQYNAQFELEAHYKCYAHKVKRSLKAEQS